MCRRASSKGKETMIKCIFEGYTAIKYTVNWSLPYSSLIEAHGVCDRMQGVGNRHAGHRGGRGRWSEATAETEQSCAWRASPAAVRGRSVAAVSSLQSHPAAVPRRSIRTTGDRGLRVR